MKLSKLLDLAKANRNDFDGADRRGILPIQRKKSYMVDDFKKVGSFLEHGPYTFDDLVKFKVYLDLVQSGLTGLEAGTYARSISQVKAGSHGSHGSLSKARINGKNYLDEHDEDIWIAREVYTSAGEWAAGVYVGNHRFSVRHWNGFRSELDAAIDEENKLSDRDMRETISVQFYNLSRCVCCMRSAVKVAGLLEARDRGDDL